MEISASALDLIGRTPLVALPRIAGDLPCTFAAKLETTNPGGSVKDRPALAMIEAAEAEGLLKPGGTIVEPTSGNTGVGLAIVAAQRGYDCVFVVTDKVATEKVALLRAYGAEVVVCPVAVAPEDPASYYSVAERLVSEIPGAYRPNQYHNPVNPLAHERSTGPEIWDQTDGRITHFVAGAGTGGTVTGVGRYLKSRNPDVQVVVADPEGSVYSGGDGRPYLVEGVGEDFWPDTYEASIVDEVIAVSDADSFATARLVSRSEGLLIGGSGGTAVHAALEVARRCGPDDVVVVLIPDSGRLYLSRLFDDDWMENRGFLETGDGPTVRHLLDARSSLTPDLVYVQPGDPVRLAFELMARHGVSQLPVGKGEMPLSAAEVVGSVDELHLIQATYDDRAVIDAPVGAVMGPAIDTIGVGQSLAAVVARFDTCRALLVLDGGRPRAVISRSDVLGFLSAAVPDPAVRDERAPEAS